MKHSLVFVSLTVAAASVAALGGACSSSSDTGTSGTTADSGTSGSSGTSGTSGTSGGTSGTSGAVVAKDTCISAGGDNTCQCSCGITGQTENKTLHCVQPAQDTGQCAKVCCTGPVDSGASGSSGTSGNVDAGDGG